MRGRVAIQRNRPRRTLALDRLREEGLGNDSESALSTTEIDDVTERVITTVKQKIDV